MYIYWTLNIISLEILFFLILIILIGILISIIN